MSLRITFSLTSAIVCKTIVACCGSFGFKIYLLPPQNIRIPNKSLYMVMTASRRRLSLFDPHPEMIIQLLQPKSHVFTCTIFWKISRAPKLQYIQWQTKFCIFVRLKDLLRCFIINKNKLEDKFKDLTLCSISD